MGNQEREMPTFDEGMIARDSDCYTVDGLRIQLRRVEGERDRVEAQAERLRGENEELKKLAVELGDTRIGPLREQVTVLRARVAELEGKNERLTKDARREVKLGVALELSEALSEGKQAMEALREAVRVMRALVWPQTHRDEMIADFEKKHASLLSPVEGGE